MCRRKYMRGCCMMAYGFGLLMGLWWDSWFWCGFGGALLVALGFLVLRRR